MIAPPKKIAIIGGGISGLSLAYRLNKLNTSNLDIRLYEKSDQLGGVIQTEEYNGFIIEKGPDGFIQQKTTVQELAKELKIDHELITTKSQNRRSMILQNNKLVEVPDGFYLMSPSKIKPFLKSPLLSWKGKIRTLLEAFVPAKKTDDEESLADFVRRRFGKENLDKISQAMLGGIYTSDPEHLSMQAALPRFSEMEKKHGSVTNGIIKSMAHQKDVSGARYGLFGTFRPGMRLLTQTLVQNIPQECLLTRSNIEKIHFNENNRTWQLLANGREEVFDTVCFAIAPHSIAGMMHHLSTEEKMLLQSIPYASSAILNFAFKNQQIKAKPAAVGFIVPHRENKHFIACSFTSDKYDHRTPEGYTLLRIFAGGALQEHLLHKPAQELRTTILAEISQILQIEGDPVFDDFAIWPKSMPQYTLGHLKRVEKIKKLFQQFPSCHLIGNAYSGVGIPDLLEQSNALAHQLVQSI
ncbi:MAG: protoporphyrinogen oxidase [Proteobacteria bacterium]|jgi:oxygen-dependent protoporphyrinogen oxidase|nr:protoporphyrinogen oxidase [Pseudomonadota bacterium]